MRLLIIYFLISLSHLCFAQHEVKAFVSFKHKKIWFQGSSNEKLFIVLTGSNLDGDSLISRSEEIDVRPMTRVNEWFHSIPNEKPNIGDGVSIHNFVKLKLLIEKNKKIKLSMIKIFTVDKNGKFSGPHYATGSLEEANMDLISKESLLFIPFKK